MPTKNGKGHSNSRDCGNQQLALAVADNMDLARIRPDFFAAYRPRAVLSWVVGRAPESGPVVALNRARVAIDGEPTLYRCENFTCDQPIRNRELEKWLNLLQGAHFSATTDLQAR